MAHLHGEDLERQRNLEEGWEWELERQRQEQGDYSDSAKRLQEEDGCAPKAAKILIFIVFVGIGFFQTVA